MWKSFPAFFCTSYFQHEPGSIYYQLRERRIFETFRGFQGMTPNRGIFLILFNPRSPGIERSFTQPSPCHKANRLGPRSTIITA
jgi:hypothetical protein